MAVNAEQLKNLHIDLKFLDPLNETFERFNINTHRKQGAFIGQMSHECGNFTKFEEGLSYSAERLTKIWPKRFPTLESAQPYARNGKALANKVYANRMGNRDEASGDGFRFRGRGAVQLTGYSQYFHASKALGVDFVMEPDLVATPKYAILTAGFFWDTHKCNEIAETGDWAKLTKTINGGLIGLDDRVKHINHALAVLG
jgi:putative chitinase